MKQPASRHLLDIAIDRLSGKYGDPLRIRRMMANTIICQMLPEELCVKGGSALKFRYGDAATRFTRDLDIARLVDLALCVKEIGSALRKGWIWIYWRTRPRPKGESAWSAAAIRHGAFRGQTSLQQKTVAHR